MTSATVNHPTLLQTFLDLSNQCQRFLAKKLQRSPYQSKERESDARLRQKRKKEEGRTGIL